MLGEVSALNKGRTRSSPSYCEPRAGAPEQLRVDTGKRSPMSPLSARHGAASAVVASISGLGPQRLRLLWPVLHAGVVVIRKARVDYDLHRPVAGTAVLGRG